MVFVQLKLTYFERPKAFQNQVQIDEWHHCYCYLLIFQEIIFANQARLDMLYIIERHLLIKSHMNRFPLLSYFVMNRPEVGKCHCAYVVNFYLEAILVLFKELP